jgi:hypothetical protein
MHYLRFGLTLVPTLTSSGVAEALKALEALKSVSLSDLSRVRFVRKV